MTLPIGVSVVRPAPQAMLDTAREADRAGVPTAWSTVAGISPDAVTILAIAATQTQRISLGTSIVPAYPRHPLVLASQALVFENLAPGRLRLGVGPSHRPTVEGVFGIPMEDPIRYMREYLTVLRQLLWEGRADVDGQFLRVHAALPARTEPPRTPLYLSALRPAMYRLAGEISDGAISWNSPIPYLVRSALPALRSAAEQAGHRHPILIAHVPVALSNDESAVRAAALAFLTRYAQLPFYVHMFRAAGYDVPGDGTVPDDLIDGLVVSGSATQIMERLRGYLDEGIGELLVTLLAIRDEEREAREFFAAIGAS
ncbi:MAG TPA: LLM class flavin-dependent oxidoreductase [Chloroflexota bacterium]|nr:LLM class flavin-dependent oxidoreductase [Chloroflexota bacterium]